MKANNKKEESTFVCDLDETLIYAIESSKEIKKIKSHPEFHTIKDKVLTFELIEPKSKSEINNRFVEIMVILRPHYKEFIDYIRTKFDRIAIFSAGKSSYVRALEFILFGENGVDKLLHRDHCTVEGNSFYKDLAKYFNIKKCMIIDDRMDVHVKNVDNVINVPEFKPKLDISEINKEESSLLKVMNWMNDHNFDEYEDFRKLKKPSLNKNDDK